MICSLHQRGMDAEVERRNSDQLAGKMCLQNKLKYLQTVVFKNCSTPVERLHMSYQNTPHYGESLHVHL